MTSPNFRTVTITMLDNEIKINDSEGHPANSTVAWGKKETFGNAWTVGTVVTYDHLGQIVTVVSAKPCPDARIVLKKNKSTVEVVFDGRMWALDPTGVLTKHPHESNGWGLTLQRTGNVVMVKFEKVA